MVSPDGSAKKVKDTIESLISSHVFNKEVKWIPSTNQHEDFDVTFTVPLNGKAIQISYRL